MCVCVCVCVCVLLLLTQVNVQDPAEEKQRHAHPGHDEAVAEVARAQISDVIQDLLPPESEDKAGSEGGET